MKPAPTGTTAPDELHLLATERLGAEGQRYTSSRRAVIQTLADSDRPLTILEILDATPSLAQSSAYRNLTELMTVGLVHRIVIGDEHSRYELAEDLTEHHHHLVCTSCGRVDDVTLADDLEAQLDSALHLAAQQLGFTPEHHRLDLMGRCKDCA